MPKKKSVIKKFRLGLFTAMLVLLLLVACGSEEEQIQPTVTPLPQPTATTELVVTPTAIPPTITVTGTPLYFETIDQLVASGTGIVYEDRQPGIIIIASRQEVSQLAGLVRVEAQAELEKLDYEKSFVVAVFQGWKPNSGYNVQIQHVSRQDNTIIIYVSFLEPGPNEASPDAVSSPYHVIKLLKDGISHQQITFKLVVNNLVVTSHSYFVP